MLGYVTANREKLSPEDLETYRAYYCGLCRTLQTYYHQAGRLTLNYDMTFLYLLLTGLYEPEEQIRMGRCMPHPMKPHREVYNEAVRYCADMNILLAYYDMLDDWEDDRKLSGRLGSGLLKKGCTEIRQRWPRQAKAVEDYLRELALCEQRDSLEIDEASGLSGRMLEEILVYRQDEWEPLLRGVGFYLGKFIYLCDAYEDLEKDLKAGRYNPWKSWRDRPDFHEEAGRILKLIMGECARNFEKLPIIEHGEILRNILYSGVWTRYEIAGRKREKGTGNDDRSL